MIAHIYDAGEGRCVRSVRYGAEPFNPTDYPDYAEDPWIVEEDLPRGGPFHLLNVVRLKSQAANLQRTHHLQCQPNR